MICWYCHWGWPKEVADIYQRYSELAGDSEVLDFGPGHIVWADENFEDHSIKSCIESAAEFQQIAPDADFSDHQLDVAVQSLKDLLAVPEDIRCCEPEGYDGENPAMFPPPDGLEMVRKR